MNKYPMPFSMTDLKLSLSEFQNYITVLGIGVIIGFISNRYMKFTILTFLVALLIIKALEYQFFLKIDWQNISQSLGIDTSATLEEWFSAVYSLVSHNIYLTAAGLVGFLIGYRAS